MKLLIMLAGIYALIINQSLKQKEINNAALPVNTSNTRSDIKPGNNIYSTAAIAPDVRMLPGQRENSSSINKDFLPALYKPHPFRARNESDGHMQEFLYPLNSSSYTPFTKKEGSR